ncbi:MAG: hypothetical protein J0M15_13010 [Deltaproteobacteria bacterium]|nr:hypothetical protein [Deltaproteobacteria bacterium]
MNTHFNTASSVAILVSLCRIKKKDSVIKSFNLTYGASKDSTHFNKRRRFSMKFLIILLSLVATTIPASAGGGGCGDVCDKYQVLMVCKATSVTFQNPKVLTLDMDKRNVDAMTRSFVPGFEATFRGISWSVRHIFDPAVIFSAWVPGSEIFSDQLKYPDYDYTKGYKINPTTGSFQFAGGISPGWEYAKAQFYRSAKNQRTRFTITSIQSGKVLMGATMMCNK